MNCLIHGSQPDSGFCSFCDQKRRQEQSQANQHQGNWPPNNIEYKTNGMQVHHCGFCRQDWYDFQSFYNHPCIREAHYQKQDPPPANLNSLSIILEKVLITLEKIQRDIETIRMRS